MRKMILANLISYVIWAITVTAGIVGFLLFTEGDKK